MAKRIAGTMFIKANGEQFEVAGSVEIPLSSVKREAVMSLNGVSGYKETAIKPYVKATLNVPASFPLATLQSTTNMTVTSELANGMVHTLSEAWVEGEPSIKADEGTVDIEFAGTKGIWQ